MASLHYTFISGAGVWDANYAPPPSTSAGTPVRETSGPVVGQRVGGSVGTSAMLAELYFTFFILRKGLAFEFAGCSSVLVSRCEHFAWGVRGMCKRAWYSEEMLLQVRGLILDAMWRSLKN